MYAQLLPEVATMANKKSNTKAKQGSAKTAAAASSKADSKKASSQKLAKSSKSSKAAKAAKDAKPGFFAGIKKYLGSVRTELRRVTWPSKKELVNYSVAVCASLVVVGVIIAVLDMGISEGLALFAGLRG